MNQLGVTMMMDTDLDGRPVLELDQIYREHSAAVSKWIRRLWGPGGLGGAEEEDLLHEVFLVVQRRLGTFRGEAALTTWLYAITLLVVSGRRRKERWRRLLWRRAEPELQLQLEPESTDEEAFERAESARLAYAVLDDLGESDRTLLILFELERLPGAEIAKILETKEANVWVRLSRARKRFRAAFQRRYAEAEHEGADDVHG